MSALSVLPGIHFLEPILRETVDALFTNSSENLLEYQLFIDKWGVLKGKRVEKESNGDCGEVVSTRYDFLVAKCFRKIMNDRAHREARTLCYLREKQVPYVPLLYGVSPYKEGATLVVDYRGPDLNQSYMRRELQLEDISRVARETLECVQSLTKAGITHYDIKPENICYARDRGTTLIDWEGTISPNETEEDNYSYTPGYLSPEACLKIPYGTVEERSKADIWGVAVTIFGVLALNGPFIKDKDESEVAVLSAIEQRLSRIPQEMINASPMKNKVFYRNRLLIFKVTPYTPATQALKKGEKKAALFFKPYNHEQYGKLKDLVLDLLKINPKERPSAEEALKKHFPPIASPSVEEAPIAAVSEAIKALAIEHTPLANYHTFS